MPRDYTPGQRARYNYLQRARRKRRRDLDKLNRQPVMRYSRKPRTNVYLPLGGFPKKMMARLRYVWQGSLDPVAGSISVQKFRANSIYDSDATGVGGQASNTDRLFAIYDKVTVLGSKIKLWPNWTTTSAKIPGILGVALSDDGNTVSTAHGSGGVENVLEQPFLSKSIRNVGITNAPLKLPIKLNFSAKKYFGTPFVTGVGEYDHDDVNNPQEQAFFEVFYVSPDNANNPDSMNIMCQIDYICMFAEPKITDHS